MTRTVALRTLLAATSLMAAAVGAQRPAATMGTVTGIVSDTALKPLAGAEVLLSGSDIVLRVDKSGRFEFLEVPAGRYVLVARKLGYKAINNQIEVRGGDTLRLSYELAPGANTLGTVTVTGKAQSIKMQEFEDRRKLGLGTYFTAEDIMKHQAMFIGDVLRQVQGVKMMGSTAVSSRGLGGRENTGCAMQIFVDGAQYNGLGRSALVNINNISPPSGVAGIEVYTGPAMTPPQYNAGPGRSCGVILIWTKDR